MLPIFTAKQANLYDQYLMQDCFIPGIILMEHAAMALCEEINKTFAPPATILCVVGKGNNGGDALAAARILRMQGFTIYVGLSSRSLKGDALTNYQYFANDEHAIDLNEQTLPSFFEVKADAIIDGLYGTGLNKGIAGFDAEVIAAINNHPAKTYAIDMPSGVFADTGKAGIAVMADHTVTFTAPKLGHFLFPGRLHTGQLHIAPISPSIAVKNNNIDMYWIDEHTLPKRIVNAHKGMFGHLGIVAGSKGMSGAAILAIQGAIASGAGLTTLCSCDCVCDKAQNTVPAAMAKSISNELSFIDEAHSFEEEMFDALVIGPGLGKNIKTKQLVTRLAHGNKPKILDADALNLLSEEKSFVFGEKTILTPHLGEFSRLTGLSILEIEANQMLLAKQFASEHRIVLLLKGATTIVTDGITSYIVTTGTPAMAKGGSGDVLSGIIGSFLAQGFTPLEAAYMGAYFAGKAAEHAVAETGEYAFSPADAIAHLKNVL